MKNLFLIFLFISLSSNAAYLVRKRITKSGTKIESVERIEKKVRSVKTIRSIREFIVEKEKRKSALYKEVLYPEDKVPAHIKKRVASLPTEAAWRGSEVRELIKTGKNSNRITITILGDGYTKTERAKFFSDSKRMVKDMFEGKTFKSYLPLFNIYAIFTPSKDSGITDRKKKNTAFGLYRSPVGSKRGILPGKASQLKKALKLIPFFTDYPIVIANDDFYGGLGGRYAITTRSETSGTMVLRHELGHNFSNVGEEYDGGGVYSGANYSKTKDVPWKHWLDGPLEVHEAKFLDGSYVWQDLGKKEFSMKFKFNNDKEHNYGLKLSSVGWESKDDVKVLLDGEPLEYNGVFTNDRSMFETDRILLTSGKHELKILDNNKDGNNILAYANSYAYPHDYNFEYGKVGAFKVFPNDKRGGYRPTDNQCIMRNMRSETFCSVDQENIWLRFLNVVNLIDSIEEKNGNYSLDLVGLENLKIKWFHITSDRKAVELRQFRNKKRVNLGLMGKGEYRVSVELVTPEIRLKTKLTKDIKKIEVQ